MQYTKESHPCALHGKRRTIDHLKVMKGVDGTLMYICKEASMCQHVRAAAPRPDPSPRTRGRRPRFPGPVQVSESVVPRAYFAPSSTPRDGPVPAAREQGPPPIPPAPLQPPPMQMQGALGVPAPPAQHVMHNYNLAPAYPPAPHHNPAPPAPPAPQAPPAPHALHNYNYNYSPAPPAPHHNPAPPAPPLHNYSPAPPAPHHSPAPQAPPAPHVMHNYNPAPAYPLETAPPAPHLHNYNPAPAYPSLLPNAPALPPPPPPAAPVFTPQPIPMSERDSIETFRQSEPGRIGWCAAHQCERLWDNLYPGEQHQQWFCKPSVQCVLRTGAFA